MIRSSGRWLLTDVQETHSSAQPQLPGGVIVERTQPPTSPLCHGEFSISMELADQERRGNRGMRDRSGLLLCVAPWLGAAPSHWEGAGPGHASRRLNQRLDKTSSVGPAAAGAPRSAEPQHRCQLLSLPPPQHPLIFGELSWLPGHAVATLPAFTTPSGPAAPVNA